MRASEFLRRLTNRDLVERSEDDRRRFARDETEGKVEMLRFLERRSAQNARRLAEAGLTDRAEAETRHAERARKSAAVLEHRKVYGDDPLLDLLGGP